MLKAVIFDMDGVLIDSEPLWQEAEIAAFGRVGLQMTREMCKETMGLRIDEVVKFRYAKNGWTGRSLMEMQSDILKKLEALINEVGQPMPGVDYALDFFEKQNFQIGLASSTHLPLIKVVLDKLNIADHFEVIHSAQFEEYGKPHPGIYLTALKKLGVAPYEAIAIEDSFNGLLAAKAARMHTICIPEPEQSKDKRFDIADIKLKSLNSLDKKVFSAFLAQK